VWPTCVHVKGRVTHLCVDVFMLVWRGVWPTCVHVKGCVTHLCSCEGACDPLVFMWRGVWPTCVWMCSCSCAEVCKYGKALNICNFIYANAHYNIYINIYSFTCIIVYNVLYCANRPAALLALCWCNGPRLLLALCWCMDLVCYLHCVDAMDLVCY